MLMVEEEDEGSYSLCQVELGSSGSSLAVVGFVVVVMIGYQRPQQN